MSRFDEMFSEQPNLLRVSQVAQLLGKTSQGVLRWINTGVLPAYKLGDTWFILRDDLRDAMSAGGNLHPQDSSPQP